MTKVEGRQDAFAPIITMTFHDVEVDLGFVRLATLSSVQGLDSLDDDNLLLNMEDTAARTLNGCRVNEMVLFS